MMRNRTQEANDIALPQGSNMPIHAYIDKYGDRLSDEALGRKVRENHEQYKQKVEASREKWEKEGKEYKELRQKLKISQSEVAAGIGVHPNTVGNFEKGGNVRSRDMFRQSSITTMKYIQIQRGKAFENLGFEIRNSYH